MDAMNLEAQLRIAAMDYAVTRAKDVPNMTAEGIVKNAEIYYKFLVSKS